VRIRLDLGYDGTEFHGWAVQPGLRTVEGLVAEALATVLRRPEPVGLTCAGRTDAGVHARGQVAHCDLEDAEAVAVPSLGRRLNGVLPADVRVRAAVPAPAGFDARFSASSRRYAYRIADTMAAVDPLDRREVLTWPRPLDLDRMGHAAAALLGEHDFAAFCRRREGATTIRSLLELSWARTPAGVAVATVRADAFCHSMVRSLVGCLLAVGEGRRPPGWAAEVLHAGARDPAVTVAPAHGLTLEEVVYPPDAELAARAEVTRARREAST
jgi:tRNA pseudouridine38-40 synthase